MEFEPGTRVRMLHEQHSRAFWEGTATVTGWFYADEENVAELTYVVDVDYPNDYPYGAMSQNWLADRTIRVEVS